MTPVKIVKVRIIKTGWDREYQVMAYCLDASEGIKRYPLADYFTADKKDAQVTAEAMLART